MSWEEGIYLNENKTDLIIDLICITADELRRVRKRILRSLPWLVWNLRRVPRQAYHRVRQNVSWRYWTCSTTQGRRLPFQNLNPYQITILCQEESYWRSQAKPNERQNEIPCFNHPQHEKRPFFAVSRWTRRKSVERKMAYHYLLKSWKSW